MMTTAARVLLFVCMTVGAQGWYYRGTTNGWGLDEMFYNEGNGLYCACLEMEQGDEFKITRHANWNEAYPSSNWRIWEGRGVYDICINPRNPHDLRVGKHEHWFLRGTFNEWGATELQVAEGGKFCTTQSFGEGGAFRVSVSPDNYMVAYPRHGDYDVTTGTGEYRVCFDALWRSIHVTKLSSGVPPTTGGGEGEGEGDGDGEAPSAADGDGEGKPWYLRGTNNGWQSTEMFYMDGQWCACVFMEADGEFKISRHAESWTEAYPSQNWRIHEGAAVYDICFSPETKKVKVGKHEHWFLRGSFNEWGEGVEMEVEQETGRFCTEQAFEEEGAFKVAAAPDDWTMPAFPARNYRLRSAGVHRVCFDALWRTFHVIKLSDIVTTPTPPSTPAPECFLGCGQCWPTAALALEC